MVAPCYKCEERRFHCHSICRKYLNYQRENRKALERKNRVVEVEGYSVVASRNRIWKG